MFKLNVPPFLLVNMLKCARKNVSCVHDLQHCCPGFKSVTNLSSPVQPTLIKDDSIRNGLTEVLRNPLATERTLFHWTVAI